MASKTTCCGLTIDHANNSPKDLTLPITHQQTRNINPHTINYFSTTIQNIY